MTGDRGLADALAGPDHGERGQIDGYGDRRLEAEVRPLVRHAEGERPARQRHALGRPEHRLVGEVDDDLRRDRLESLVEGLEERHPVVLSSAKLLGPAQEHRSRDVVAQARERDPDHIRIVLAVDESQRPHCLLVTSPSIRVVYFSNSSVSAENWMIRSWSWYGYFRQTSTCLPSISIRL